MRLHSPFRLFPAAVMVIVATAAVAQAQAHPANAHPPHERKRAEREQIEALEKQFQAAQRAGDTATMDKLLSDDYLGINPSGVVMTKEQQLEHMHSRKLVINSLETSDQKIKLIGPIAIVTCLAEIEGMNDGVPLHGKFRYTRIYQHLADGNWKITSFEATRLAKQLQTEPTPAAPPQPSAPKG